MFYVETYSSFSYSRNAKLLKAGFMLSAESKREEI